MKNPVFTTLALALLLLTSAALQAADRVDQLRAKLMSRDIPDVLVVATAATGVTPPKTPSKPSSTPSKSAWTWSRSTASSS